MEKQPRPARLASAGDKVERGHWGHMQKLVPHYETFWQLFVYPLRAEGSIWFRQGVDSQVEGIAIASYSSFEALARARHKIFVDHEEYGHVEELYAALQRSAEIGVKLIQQFAAFYSVVKGRSSMLSAAPLQDFIDSRIKRYRNLLHDEMMAMPKDESGRRLIPRLDNIDEYRSWTKAMYGFRRELFVTAADQVKSDFLATCSRLEANWKLMSAAYKDFAVSRDFQVALSKGHRVGPMQMPAASGSFYLGAIGHGGQPASGAFTVFDLTKQKFVIF